MEVSRSAIPWLPKVSGFSISVCSAPARPDIAVAKSPSAFDIWLLKACHGACTGW